MSVPQTKNKPCPSLSHAHAPSLGLFPRTHNTYRGETKRARAHTHRPPRAVLCHLLVPTVPCALVNRVHDRVVLTLHVMLEFFAGWRSYCCRAFSPKRTRALLRTVSCSGPGGTSGENPHVNRRGSYHATVRAAPPRTVPASDRLHRSGRSCWTRKSSPLEGGAMVDLHYISYFLGQTNQQPPTH